MSEGLRVAVCLHRIRQLHDRADCGIEMEALDVERDLAYGQMNLTQQVAVRLRVIAQRLSMAAPRTDRNLPFKQSPNAVQEAVHPLYATVAPFGVFVGRAYEQYEQPGGVRTITLYHIVYRHNVAFALGHLRATQRNHPLCEQAQERLLCLNPPCVSQHLHKEARVQ